VQPVSCRYSASFDFHTTLASVLGTTLVRYQVIQQREAVQNMLVPPLRMMEPLHHEELPVTGVMGLIQQGAGHGPPGAARIASHPACLSWHQCRTRSPLAVPAGVAPWSAKWRNLWPSATTRKPFRWRALYRRVGHCVRKALRTGDARAARVFGSVVNAWRRQWPRRAPGPSGRMLLMGLSKPSVRIPRTRYEGSC
jgi:hypothetical protein